MNHNTTLRTVAALGAFGLILTACGRDGEAEGESVALSVSTLNNPFFVDLRDGAEEAAAEHDLDLEVVDAQNDSTAEANQIADAVTGGAQSLIINPVDSDAAAASIGPALNDDLPVVAVDRAVEGEDVDVFISSDNVAGGEQAAHSLAEEIEEEGEVVVLQGVAGTSASRDRGEGFETGIAEYDGIDVVAVQTANFDRAEALDVTTNLLQSHPDVVGVFAENDEMALGAVEALGERAGDEVFVVGFDGTEDALDAVDSGRMLGTIAQQPAELGREAVEALVGLLNGESVDEEIPVDVQTVTSENVDEFTQ